MKCNHAPNNGAIPVGEDFKVEHKITFEDTAPIYNKQIFWSYFTVDTVME